MKDILFWTNVLQNNIDVQFTCIFVFIGNSKKKKGILCYIAVHTLGLSRQYFNNSSRGSRTKYLLFELVEDSFSRMFRNPQVLPCLSWYGMVLSCQKRMGKLFPKNTVYQYTYLSKRSKSIMSRFKPQGDTLFTNSLLIYIYTL